MMQSPRRLACGLVSVLALSTLLLSGCSRRFPPQEPLPDLHVPGVTQVPGVTTLHRGVGRGDIYGLTTASSLNSATAPRAVMALDDELYSIGLDGSLPQRIPTTCIKPRRFGADLAVSSDGQWLYCSGDSFTISSLISDTAGEQTVQLLTTTGQRVYNTFGHVAVSPDGKYLALVTNEILDCAIAFYAVAPTHDTVTLVGVIPLTALLVASVSTQCKVRVPAWSSDGPDGPWLTFALCAGTCAIEALPLRPYLSRFANSGRQPITFSLDAAQVLHIADAPQMRSPAWTRAPDGLRLNYLPTDDTKAIWQVSLATGTPHLLLALPTDMRGRINALAATPNGAGLVFAHSMLQGLCPECQPGETPSHLYYFTPV